MIWKGRSFHVPHTCWAGDSEGSTFQQVEKHASIPSFRSALITLCKRNRLENEINIHYTQYKKTWLGIGRCNVHFNYLDVFGLEGNFHTSDAMYPREIS